MSTQCVSKYFLVRDVLLKCFMNVGLQDDTTESEVLALVAEESCTLLDGVVVTGARSASHVRDRKALNGITTVEFLAAHENVRVVPLPWNV